MKVKIDIKVQKTIDIVDLLDYNKYDTKHERVMNMRNNLYGTMKKEFGISEKDTLRIYVEEVE